MKPYLLIGLYIFPLLIGVFLINYFSPDASLAPNPYSSSIIAFEFATSYDEILQVLDPLSQDEINNLDRVNHVDFGFMLCYCLFLFSFLFISKNIDAKRLFIPGCVLIIIIFLSDIIETITLLDISRLYQNKSAPELFLTPLKVLQLSTWSKWIVLAICLGLFAYILINRKETISTVFGFLLTIPLFLSIAAFFGGPQLKDIFATSIFGGFGCLLIYCLIYKSKRPSKHT